MRRRLTDDDVFEPNNATSDYDDFTRMFRVIAKHPQNQTFGIPHLPLSSEITPSNLPQPQWDTDPTVEQIEALTLSRGRGRGRERERGRGRELAKSKYGRKINKPVAKTSSSENKFRSHFLASMMFQEKRVLLLYSRADVYLVAIQDSKNNWWEFSVNGGELFPGTRGLGFTESYLDMGTGSEVKLGHYSIETAFHVFSDPEQASINDRKKAPQIVIALTSESGRLLILCNKIRGAVNDFHGIYNVELSGPVRMLMRNWETMCRFIIENSGPENSKKKIRELLPKTVKSSLVDELEAGGMILVENAPVAYGLLKSSSSDGEPSMSRN